MCNVTWLACQSSGCFSFQALPILNFLSSEVFFCSSTILTYFRKTSRFNWKREKFNSRFNFLLFVSISGWNNRDSRMLVVPYAILRPEGDERECSFVSALFLISCCDGSDPSLLFSCFWTFRQIESKLTQDHTRITRLPYFAVKLFKTYLQLKIYGSTKESLHYLDRL